MTNPHQIRCPLCGRRTTEAHKAGCPNAKAMLDLAVKSCDVIFMKSGNRLIDLYDYLSKADNIVKEAWDWYRGTKHARKYNAVSCLVWRAGQQPEVVGYTEATELVKLSEVLREGPFEIWRNDTLSKQAQRVILGVAGEDMGRTIEYLDIIKASLRLLGLKPKLRWASPIRLPFWFYGVGIGFQKEHYNETTLEDVYKYVSTHKDWTKVGGRNETATNQRVLVPEGREAKVQGSGRGTVGGNDNKGRDADN